MGIPSAVIAVLTALPEILKLLEQVGPELATLTKSLVTWLKHVSGNDPQGYLKKVGEAFAQLEQAQGVIEKEAAAKKIADLIRGLP